MSHLEDCKMINALNFKRKLPLKRRLPDTSARRSQISLNDRGSAPLQRSCQPPVRCEAIHIAPQRTPAAC